MKYVIISIKTSDPNSFRKHGISLAQAKKNFREELNLYYRLDEIARPIVLAAIIFVGMSLILYITAKDPFL